MTKELNEFTKLEIFAIDNEERHPVSFSISNNQLIINQYKNYNLNNYEIRVIKSNKKIKLSNTYTIQNNRYNVRSEKVDFEDSLKINISNLGTISIRAPYDLFVYTYTLVLNRCNHEIWDKEQLEKRKKEYLKNTDIVCFGENNQITIFFTNSFEARVAVDYKNFKDVYLGSSLPSEKSITIKNVPEGEYKLRIYLTIENKLEALANKTINVTK